VEPPDFARCDVESGSAAVELSGDLLTDTRVVDELRFGLVEEDPADGLSFNVS
jgi:hypothetical protein